MSIFRGNATAVITPFNDSGIDYEAFGKQIDFQIDNGTVALIVAGTTGEPATMSSEEKAELLKYAIKKVNKRVPIVFGTGCNDTKQTIKNSKQAQEIGADALLIVTPYYNKTSQDGLVAHFHAVADEVDIPIMIYNVPSRTGLNITAETLVRIAKHKNIVAHKEAGGSIRQVMDMIRLCGDSIDMYSGDDTMTFPLLACGGIGSVSVISNIMPAETAKMVDSYLAGDIDTAREMQYKLDDMINALFWQVNPIPVKAAMNIMGLNAGDVRLPLVNLEGDERDALAKLIKDKGLI